MGRKRRSAFGIPPMRMDTQLTKKERTEMNPLKNPLSLLTLATALVCVISITACNKTKPPREVTPQEVIGLLNNGFAEVVDVRESADDKGIIRGAQRIPLNDAEKDGPVWTVFVSKASKDKTLVFYGTLPEEGRRAAEIASRLGHTTAYLPSFESWVAASGQTAPAESAPCASAKPGDPMMTNGMCRVMKQADKSAEPAAPKQ
jgi:rhodanese-related sulfurtransferase